MRAYASKDRFISIASHENSGEYIAPCADDNAVVAKADGGREIPEGLAELRTPEGNILIQERRATPRGPSDQKTETKPRSYAGSPQMMGLGGLIIIGVLVASYTTKYDLAIGHVHGALMVPAVGYLALQLFLARAALRLYDDVKNYKSLSDFIISRFFRYIPAVMPAVLLGFVIVQLVGLPGMHAPLKSLPANLLMVADMVGVADIDSSHWRLKIEIIQAVLVAAAWFGPLKKLLPALLTVALAINAFSVSGEPVRHNLLTLHGMMTNDGYLPLFVFGVALYHLTLDRGAPVWRVMLFSAGTLAFLSNTPVHGAFVVVGLAALTSLAMGGMQWLGRCRWLSHLGEIAFPIYVVHFVLGFAIIHRLEHFGCPSIIAMTVASAAAIIAGKLLNAFVERPMQSRAPGAMQAFNSAITRIARRPAALRQPSWGGLQTLR